MFFILLLLLLFSTFFSSNALKCMTRKNALSNACSFELKTDDPLPDDATITAHPNSCAIRDVALFNHGATSDGSCYAEIIINYSTQKMSVQVTGLNLISSMISPYDDMFGLLTGIKSVVQYKIQGKWVEEELVMTTRFQCSTHDNCALDKLRKLLSNLTIAENRLKMFNHVKDMLNPPDSGDNSPLICLTTDPDIDVSCSAVEKSCQFRRDKEGLSDVGCVKETDGKSLDLEYRFNIVEEMATVGVDTSAKARKIFFTCNTNHCNNDGNSDKIDELLISLAAGAWSLENVPVHNNSSAVVVPQGAPNPQPTKLKPNSATVPISISYLWMVLANVLLLQLSN